MTATGDRATLIVPGWQGSGAQHWQSWLENQLTAVGRTSRRPDFADLEHPDLDDWLTALRRALQSWPSGEFDVVAHSLGAVLWLHHAVDPGDSPRPDRVLLVSPPSPTTAIPEIAAFYPPPLDAVAVNLAAASTELVAGDDDPYLLEGIATAYGRPLHLEPIVIERGGHLSANSGYGPWPAVLEWCLNRGSKFRAIRNGQRCL